MFKHFFVGFIRVHLLYHASRGKIFGFDMIKELARHGYQVSPGTLYPILHSLENGGYLKSAKESVGGRIRRCYQITPEGKEALSEIKEKIRELIDEVMG
jgi:DNA-binding PadR family transcriptional regulator